MRFLLLIPSLIILSTTPVFAEAVQPSGYIEQHIDLTHANALYPNGYKEIKIMEYEWPESLQTETYQHIQRRLEQHVSRKPFQNNNLPKKVQLGMENVPVLDQGLHNTCSVFAVTAGLDAALKRGDYVSQLCLLQLGNYLAQESGKVSGWDGESLTTILQRVDHYGVMSITNQHRYGCGGHYLYPSYFFTPGTAMTPEDYAEHRLLLKDKRIGWQYMAKNRLNTVQKLKEALYARTRLVIAASLPRADLGTTGATGRYHYRDDTWVLTPEISQDVLHSKKIARHAMVITGYDDEAIVTDRHGKTHQGLFKIRNSWGPWVGDWGDFYMSYDYAAELVHQVVQIKVQ
jgi:hypothetical protein